MATRGRCLARLTSWDKTNCAIGTSNKRASIVKVCKNVPEKGQSLCQECAERPTESKYQTRMIHGVLTDAPCEGSHIYGSSWYWQQVAMYGETDDTDWIAGALKAQKEAEEFCGSTDPEAWKVQRPDQKELVEMQKRKKKENKEVAAARVAAVKEKDSEKGKGKDKDKDKAKKGTLLESFPLIRVMYQESEKTPEKLATDSCPIWKDVKEGVDVWVSESGYIFACDSTGGVGELIETPT